MLRIGFSRRRLLKPIDELGRFVARQRLQPDHRQQSIALQFAQQVGQKTSAEVLRAHRGQEEDRRAGQMADGERDELQAFLVGPLQIVEDEDHRMLPRTHADEFDHGVVQSASVVPGALDPVGPISRPDAAGAEQHQFVPRRRPELSVEVGVFRQGDGVQQIGPEAKRERALGPASAHRQVDHALRGKILDETVEQMTLADAGLADHHDQAAAALPGLRQVLAEGLQLRRTTHRDRTRGGELAALGNRRRPRDGLLERLVEVGRGGRPLFENALVERVGLLVGRNTQLALEKVTALAILVKRRGAHSIRHEKAHQAPVYVLAVAVDPERPLGRLDTRGNLSGLFLAIEEVDEGLQCGLLQTASDGDQPVIEIGRIDGETLQEATGVARGRLGEPVGAAVGGQALEFAGVDPDQVGVERDHLALHA